jgi:hypothetical protein
MTFLIREFVTLLDYDRIRKINIKFTIKTMLINCKFYIKLMLCKYKL